MNHPIPITADFRLLDTRRGWRVKKRFYLPAGYVHALKDAASRLGVSENEIVINALADWLLEEQRQSKGNQ